MKDARALANDITELIVRPSKRTRQVQIGPSNIGDPCDRCLGMAMAAMLPDGPKESSDHFNLMAWVGTGVHDYLLERIIPKEDWPGLKIEYKISIGKVGKYGRVNGSLDLYSQPHRTLLDVKMRGKDKIKLWRSGVPIPEETRAQAHIYGYGLEREKLPVEEICIFMIPRDSMLISDVWQYIEPYDRQIALVAIARAAELWDKYVSKGKVELLRSHRDCYNCSAYRRNVRFVRG